MGTFATYSEQEGETRSSIRVEDDGTVMVLVTGRHGEVLHSVDRKIDPTRAASIVSAVAIEVPDLSDGHGPCRIGFGRGAGQPATWGFDPAHASASLVGVVARLRNLLEELLSNHRMVQRARMRGPSSVPDRGLTPGGFATWAVLYFVAHMTTVGLGIAAVLIGLYFVTAVGSTAAGVWALLGILGVLALTAATFFFLGRAQGRRYGDVAAVWQSALAAIALPGLIGGLLSGSIGLSAGTFFLPLMAKLGAMTVTD